MYTYYLFLFICFVVGVCFFLKQGPCVVGMTFWSSSFQCWDYNRHKNNQFYAVLGTEPSACGVSIPPAESHPQLIRIYSSADGSCLPVFPMTVYAAHLSLSPSSSGPSSAPLSGCSCLESGLSPPLTQVFQEPALQMFFFLTFLFSFWYPAHLSQSIQKPIYCTVLPPSHILEHLLAWRMKPKWP